MQCDLRYLDWSLFVVDTNSIIFIRENQQELIRAQAMHHH